MYRLIHGLQVLRAILPGGHIAIIPQKIHVTAFTPYITDTCRRGRHVAPDAVPGSHQKNLLSGSLKLSLKNSGRCGGFPPAAPLVFTQPQSFIPTGMNTVILPQAPGIDFCLAGHVELMLPRRKRELAP
jgi:hypothetical protein